MQYTLLIIPALLLAGCDENVDPRGKRVAVRGEVTLDGKPLTHARIVFQPADGTATVTATASIVDGTFAIPAKHGSLIGTMRVSIEPETVDLEEFQSRKKHEFRTVAAFQTVRISMKYNRKTTLTATVSDDETRNTFNFALKSR